MCNLDSGSHATRDQNVVHGPVRAKISIDNAQKICGGAVAAVRTSEAIREQTITVALPYRFKAGGSGNMAPVAGQHHHRSTTKHAQKPFKSKHASKGALKELSKGK